MNVDYCMEGIANATTERASWLRKFNPGSYARNYAMFIFIFIIIIVIMFIMFWRYIRPKWYKKNIKSRVQILSSYKPRRRSANTISQ